MLNITGEFIYLYRSLKLVCFYRIREQKWRSSHGDSNHDDGRCFTIAFWTTFELWRDDAMEDTQTY